MCAAVSNICMELWMGEHWIVDGMDGIVLDSRWDGWDRIGYLASLYKTCAPHCAGGNSQLLR